MPSHSKAANEKRMAASHVAIAVHSVPKLLGLTMRFISLKLPRNELRARPTHLKSSVKMNVSTWPEQSLRLSGSQNGGCLVG